MNQTQIGSELTRKLVVDAMDIKLKQQEMPLERIKRRFKHKQRSVSFYPRSAGSYIAINVGSDGSFK